MQSLLKAMNCDLQGLWIARLARDPLLVSGLLLPVWCVGARTRFLMTRCYNKIDTVVYKECVCTCMYVRMYVYIMLHMQVSDV